MRSTILYEHRNGAFFRLWYDYTPGEAAWRDTPPSHPTVHVTDVKLVQADGAQAAQVAAELFCDLIDRDAALEERIRFQCLEDAWSEGAPRER